MVVGVVRAVSAAEVTVSEIAVLNFDSGAPGASETVAGNRNRVGCAFIPGRASVSVVNLVGLLGGTVCGRYASVYTSGAAPSSRAHCAGECCR